MVLIGSFGLTSTEQRRLRDQHDRHEVAIGVERHGLVDHLVLHRDAGRGDQERVAVRLRLGDGGSADIAVGAGAVVDDERLPELFRQFAADAPRQEIDAAAGLERRDERHRLGRPRLRATLATERAAPRRRQATSGRSMLFAIGILSVTSIDHIAMPAALMIGPHFATSPAMKSRKSSGVPPDGCMSSVSRSLRPCSLSR